MTTVTLTQARANLGKLCDRAKKGEEIGIIAGNQVLQLQPVEVRPKHPGELAIIPLEKDYVAQEYGLSEAELAAFRKRERTRNSQDKKAGRVVPFKGKFTAAQLD